MSAARKIYVAPEVRSWRQAEPPPREDDSDSEPSRYEAPRISDALRIEELLELLGPAQAGYGAPMP